MLKLELTETQAESLLTALDLAISDQIHYLDYGSPEIDYGQEWPEVAANKAADAETWAIIATALTGDSALAQNARNLAEQLRENDAPGYCTIHTDTPCQLDGSLAVICPKCVGTTEGDSRL